MQAVEHFITQFVPEHYDLFLDLSRETKTFSGKVTNPSPIGVRFMRTVSPSG